MSLLLSNPNHVRKLDLRGNTPSRGIAMQIKDGPSGAALAYGYILSFKGGHLVNHQIDKSLTGKLFYSSFGDDVKRLQLAGLMIVDTSSDATTPEGGGASEIPSGLETLLTFFHNNKATAAPITAADEVAVTLDGVIMSGLLVGCTYEYTIEKADTRLINFTMYVVITDDGITLEEE